MHIFITGGQGYIGSYLTKALLDAGHIVTTLDSAYNSIRVLDFSGYGSRLVRHQASVTNIDAVGRAMAGANVVIHLAARSMYDDTPRRDIIRLYETNVIGTTVVLSTARKIGVDKVIFASSAAVYGNIVGARPTDPCVPVNIYGSSKLAAEATCRGFYQLGLDVIMLRMANVWGRRGSCSIVNKFAAGWNTVHGDGSQTRDFIFIDDVVNGLLASLRWDANIYNLATGVETSISGLFNIINPGKTMDFVEPEQPEIYRSCLDVNETPYKVETLISELDGDGIRERCLA